MPFAANCCVCSAVRAGIIPLPSKFRFGEMLTRIDSMGPPDNTNKLNKDQESLGTFIFDYRDRYESKIL